MRAVLCALLAALAARSAERPPALFCRHEHCRHDDGMLQDQDMINDYRINVITVGYNLIIFCFEASALDSPTLPRAEHILRMSNVTLYKCAPPTAGSLADMFAALNVVLEYSEPDSIATCELRGVLKLWGLPIAPPLAARHFIGLENLTGLEVHGQEFSKPNPEYGFLAQLRNLRFLEIKNVVLPPGEVVVTPTLESLFITDWTESRPAPLTHCNALRELHLRRPELNALPDGWVANCSRLEVLVVGLALHLYTLPPKLLVGTSALRQFTIEQGRLETLPAGLLDYSPNINSIKWKSNRLQTLPRGLFDKARRVQELDLSSNDLHSGVMDALAPLEQLTELNLELNRRLGDICGMDGYSSIRNLTKLRKLLLADTGVTRICCDWREDMTHLETLDLSMTKVTELSFEDLQFTRTVEASVVLLNVPVTAIVMTQEDYNNAPRASLVGGVSLQLKTMKPLECDCRMYWTRRALDLALPVLRNVSGFPCNDGRRLRDVPPENLVCARPEECAAAELPPTCTCVMWAADDPDHDPRLVRVHCEHAALYKVPRPHFRNSSERFYELLLADNRIFSLHTDDLQPNIKGLDLRNNFLKGVDAETAKRLGDMDGMLRLAGNPLECSCDAAPLLSALYARSATQTDLSNATCSDKSPLEAASIANCLVDVPTAPSVGTWLAIVFGMLLLTVFAAVSCLTSHERRFFVQAVLHRWGCEWHAAELQGDEDRHYDAFVTFSHKDEALVPELISRLEPTYRLCVHCRDWTPGRFISEQVVESVRESRRTIALVSRHFLASSWARAEFREAHAAAMLDTRPRLIVVLLEEPAALEMDDLLRRYVTTHTYLRWGEPWFWDKLAVALPRPRAPRGPEPATPTSPPALALEMSHVCDQAIAETDADAPAFAVHSESCPNRPPLS